MVLHPPPVKACADSPAGRRPGGGDAPRRDSIRCHLPSLIHVVGVDLAFAAWGAAKNPIEVPGNCRSQKPAIGQELSQVTGPLQGLLGAGAE
jgi:hypothetical protein